MVDAGGPGTDPWVPGLEWIEELGAGGFGSVHRARDDAHGRDVAVKLLHASTDERTRRRFDRERRLMGSISNHPNVVTIFTSGFTDQGVPYLVMELIEGGSLSGQIAGGGISAEAVQQLGVKLGEALSAAHDAGVLHLDIKPDNVLMGANDEPLLADFGIASSMNEIALRQTISISPSFSAPEMLNTAEIDARADVYSLAATLYACLTGSVPYDGADGVLGAISRMATQPVPRIHDPGVPAALADLLAEAMAKEAADRPTTMRAFTDRLAAIDISSATSSAAPNTVALASTPTPAPAHPAPTDPAPHPGLAAAQPAAEPSAAKRAPLALAAVAAALVLGIVGVVVLLNSGGSDGSADVATGPGAVATETARTVATTQASTDEVTGNAPDPTEPPEAGATTTATPEPTAAPTPEPTATPQPALGSRPTPPPRATAEAEGLAVPTPIPADALVRDAASDFRWARDVDGAGEPIGVVQGPIPLDAPMVCVRFSLFEPVGGRLGFNWTVPGEPDFTDREVLDFSGTDTEWFDCYDARNVCGTCVIPEGIIEFEFQVDGETLLTRDRKVGAAPFRVITIVNDTEIPLCQLNVSDSQATFWGPTELTRFLLPGQSKDVPRPESSYDIRGVDCDGRELIRRNVAVEGDDVTVRLGG